ncbi:MAG: IS3 family transposase [Chitinophagaceae bacterium]
MREQCELLGMYRSNYYYEHKPIITPEEKRIMDAIDVIYTKRPFYGVRKITEQLRLDGEIVNHKRVHRIMQILGIEAMYPKPNLSQNNTLHPIYPYLLKHKIITSPNQVWGVDITYIRLHNEWLYLVAILDWHSRYILSWELSDTMSVAFCCEALKKALRIGIPKIHNSDQGVQFTAEEYVAILKANPGIQISMDHKGRCFDNIFTERLWRTIKYEEVYLKSYESPREARQSIRDYIAFYNTERLHQALHYKTPADIYFGKFVN